MNMKNFDNQLVLSNFGIIHFHEERLLWNAMLFVW